MSDEESNEHAAEDSEQSDEQLLANEQSQESEASEKSAEQSQEQPAESDQWTSSLRDPQNLSQASGSFLWAGLDHKD
jgi:hypothetical protein